MNIGTLVVTQNGTTFNAQVKADGCLFKVRGELVLESNEYDGKAVVYKLSNRQIVDLYLKDDPKMVLVSATEKKVAAPVVAKGLAQSQTKYRQPEVKSQVTSKQPNPTQSEFLPGKLFPGEGKIEPVPRKKKFVCNEIKGMNEYHGKDVEFKVGDNREVIYVRLKESGKVLFEKELPQPVETVKVAPSTQQKVQASSQQASAFQPVAAKRPVQSHAQAAVPSAAQKQSVNIHKNVLQKPNAQGRVSGQAATAPYNFVPLNDCVVPAEYDEKPPAFDKYHEGTHTGYIQVQITTKTPLFIRGTLGEKDLEQGRESKDDERFYAPTGRPAIPGSSLRGLVRNALQIASWAKFTVDEDYQDSELYYREVATGSNTGNRQQQEYVKHIKNGDSYIVRAGILSKEKGKYIIRKLINDMPVSEKSENLYPYKKRDNEICSSSTYTVYFSDQQGFYIIQSGKMPGKKKDWKIDSRESGKRIELTEIDIEAYKNDSTRKAINLLSRVREGAGLPCFYTEWTDKNGESRIAFGHTVYFRLPYKQSISAHVSDELKKDVVDIPGAVFGNKDKFAGRVQFSDAQVDSDSGWFEESGFAKILSSPKPTSFQHYLVQDQRSLKEHPNNLHFYDGQTLIRGYKQYWHRSGNSWRETDQESLRKDERKEPSKRQHTKIQPVKTGVSFTGKIHFENLSSVELGALLFVLKLPQGCAHKLGMGKPLGLGSVQIHPTLYLSCPKKRYETLFAEWGGLSQVESAEYDKYKNKFEAYVLEHIGSTAKSLWKEPRMEQYETLLKFDSGRVFENQNRIDYMPMNSFRDRPVLPAPMDVRQARVYKSRSKGRR